MALRPLMHWPRLRHHFCAGESLSNFFAARSPPSPPQPSSKASKLRHQQQQLFLLFNPKTFHLSDNRSLHLRASALKLPNVPQLRSDSPEGDSESDSSSSSDGVSAAKKSRNQKKREAKRSFRWGMELANFSPPQIKLILRATSLESEVYDALMLVKRFGSDVREGKRRQFNYIGRLLRKVEPELMDELIQATKDGDNDKLRSFCGSETQAIEDGSETWEESEDEYGEEDSKNYIALANRWFEGFINKDIEVMNEIYSLNIVEFDRQELRSLVRKVHVVQEHPSRESEENYVEVNPETVGARRSLSRFLQSLAKQLPVE